MQGGRGMFVMSGSVPPARDGRLGLVCSRARLGQSCGRPWTPRRSCDAPGRPGRRSVTLLVAPCHGWGLEIRHVLRLYRQLLVGPSRLILCSRLQRTRWAAFGLLRIATAPLASLPRRRHGAGLSSCWPGCVCSCMWPPGLRRQCKSVVRTHCACPTLVWAWALGGRYCSHSVLRGAPAAERRCCWVVALVAVPAGFR